MRTAHIGFTALAALLASSPAFAQGSEGQVPTPGHRADQPTSDRTPGKSTTMPLKEVTQTDDGRTSDRTPKGGPGDQQGGQPGSRSDSSNNGMQGQQSGMAGQNMQSAQSGRPMALTPDKLRQSLTKAGFSDVVILDQAYLVRGRTGDGDIVFMMINPPTASTAVISPSSGSASAGSGSGSSGSSAGDVPNASAPGPK